MSFIINNKVAFILGRNNISKEICRNEWLQIHKAIANIVE